MKRRWFQRILWIGIAANFSFAIPMLVAPESLLAWSGMPAASPATWPRLAALLSLLLSVFYMPAAIDPDRYRVVARLAVAARLAGAVFFFSQSHEYYVFGLFDLAFFVPLALLAS